MGVEKNGLSKCNAGSNHMKFSVLDFSIGTYEMEDQDDPHFDCAL